MLRSIYQKNGKAMAFVLEKILEIDQVIRKLSRFSQVQSERERTLVSSGQILYRAAPLETKFSTSLQRRFIAESSQEFRRNAVP